MTPGPPLPPEDNPFAAWEPALRPPALLAGDVSYAVEDTVIGRMLLARTATGALVASSFVPDAAAEDRVLTRVSARVSPRVLRRPGDLDAVRRALAAYLEGRERSLDVRTDLALATPFQRAVLTELAARVGYGEQATYGGLAAALGRAGASRAVGTALGANPLCVVLPCHRVLAASGALTGYAGGLAAKEYLLALEAGAVPLREPGDPSGR